jgi:hypothetical protein
VLILVFASQTNLVRSKPEPDLVCDAEINLRAKGRRPFRRGLQIACLLQLARARRIERHPSNKQRALLFLSGVSLIGCRGLLSGMFSVELICSVTVFVSLARPVQHACSEPSVFALLHIQILKGFVLTLQPPVGRNPRKTEPKFRDSPDRQVPAVRLFSTRAENTRTQ